MGSHDCLWNQLRGELEMQHAALLASLRDDASKHQACLMAVVRQAIGHRDRPEPDSREEVAARVEIGPKLSLAIGSAASKCSAPALPKSSPRTPRTVSGLILSGMAAIPAFSPRAPALPEAHISDIALIPPSSMVDNTTVAYGMPQRERAMSDGSGMSVPSPQMPEKISRQVTPLAPSYVFQDQKTKSMDTEAMTEFIGTELVLKKHHQPKSVSEGFASRLVGTQRFETIISLVILMNSMFLGYTTTYAATHLQKQTTWNISIVEMIFHSIFVSELTLRLYAYRIRFFTNEDWKWNIFDLCLMSTVLIDILTLTASQTGEGDDGFFNLTFVRLLRLLKTLKVLRMVRAIRFFHELRLMLQSIMGSMVPLIWALVMLIALMYLGCLVFVQAATQLLAHPEGTDPAIIEKAEKYWGSIYKGISTLWMAISGGYDWFEFAQPLREAGEHYFVMFELFIAFLTLAVLNILTGIFVEKAVEAAENDRDNIVFQHAKHYNSFASDVQDIFSEVDTDDTGTISWAEFRKCMDDTAMQAYFHNVGIDQSDAAFFFRLLSQGSLDGEVDQEAFLKGCQRLKGGARMMDTQAICCQVQTLFKGLETLAFFCEAQFERLLPPESAGEPRSTSSVRKDLKDLRLSQIAPGEISM